MNHQCQSRKVTLKSSCPQKPSPSFLDFMTVAKILKNEGGVIAERAVPDSEPVPVQRGDGAFISSGFSPECISLCVVVSESKAHKNA